MNSKKKTQAIKHIHWRKDDRVQENRNGLLAAEEAGHPLFNQAARHGGHGSDGVCHSVRISRYWVPVFERPGIP